MEIPFFLPTSGGDLSASASLPGGGALAGRPTLLLTGGWHGRARTVLTLPLARRLAARGVPALRLDYPGSGLTPAGRPDEEAVVRMLAEAGGFFRDACGASELAIVGSCLGARLGIAVAARDPAVTHVVGVAAPLGVARREPRFALRRRRPDWVPGMAEAVVAAARTARLTFVYGGEDRSYRLFGEFTARAVPAEAAARLEVVAREGVRVHGFLDLSAEPERWLVDTIDAMLSGETAASAASARGEAATPAGSER